MREGGGRAHNSTEVDFNHEVASKNNVLRIMSLRLHSRAEILRVGIFRNKKGKSVTDVERRCCRPCIMQNNIIDKNVKFVHPGKVRNKKETRNA